MNTAMFCRCEQCQNAERVAAAFTRALQDGLARVVKIQEQRHEHEQATGIVIKFPIERRFPSHE